MTNLLLCHHNNGVPEWNLLHLSQAGRDAHLANHPLDFIPEGPSCPADQTTTTVVVTDTTLPVDTTIVVDSTVPVSSVQPSAPTTVAPLGETVTSVAMTVQAQHLPATGGSEGVVLGGGLGLLLVGAILLSLRSSRKRGQAV